MINLPDPLTPPCCDLRAYDWFPFFHKRLRQSSFWKRASDLACRISVDLWAEAYEQVPAASVPDDDHLLAEWAGFGRRDIAGWMAVKDEVMGAWVRCCDGRWYHPTLSEVARESFVKHRAHAWARECDRLRKENARRAKNNEPPLPMPPKPSDDPFEDVGEVLRGAAEASSDSVPMEFQKTSGGHPAEGSPNPAENALTGTGTLSSSLRSGVTHASVARPEDGPPKPKAPRRHPFPPDAFDRWYAGYPHKIGRAAAEKAFAKVRASDTVSLDQLQQAVERYRRSKPTDHAWCNPATWLNQARWTDEPAKSLAPSPTQVSDYEPRFDFGNGMRAPYSTIRSTWDRGRWLSDWGPRPGDPGCRISPEMMDRIMGERRAA